MLCSGAAEKDFAVNEKNNEISRVFAVKMPPSYIRFDVIQSNIICFDCTHKRFPRGLCVCVCARPIERESDFTPVACRPTESDVRPQLLPNCVVVCNLRPIERNSTMRILYCTYIYNIRVACSFIGWPRNWHQKNPFG